MTHDRLRAAEQNIEQIRGSVHEVEIAQARQGVEISNIKDTLNRFETTFQDISKSLNAITSTMQEMTKTQAAMQATLAVNTSSLNEHMRRTDLLESQTKELMKFKWQAMAIITLVTVVGSYVGGLLPKF